jgi:hypothetical protein
VTARDASGNLISGATVVLAATGTGNTLTQPAGSTNGSGVATGTLSSTVAESKTVSATISGVAITQTASVTVAAPPNSPPVVNAGPNQTAVTGLLYTLTWSFTDANNNGPWSYTIDWGDGSTSTGSVSSQGTFNSGHTYVVLLPTSFTVTVTVTDAASASGSASKVVTVLLL